jgi:hypothetical protein
VILIIHFRIKEIIFYGNFMEKKWGLPKSVDDVIAPKGKKDISVTPNFLRPLYNFN